MKLEPRPQLEPQITILDERKVNIDSVRDTNLLNVLGWGRGFLSVYVVCI